MQLVVTLLVTAMTALHAGLGCCAYHRHCPAEQEVASARHECHDHHGDSDEPLDRHSRNCDQEHCSFVTAKSSSSTAAEMLGAMTPLAIFTPALEFGVGRLFSFADSEDTPHLNGPAVHLWHGILVI